MAQVFLRAFAVLSLLAAGAAVLASEPASVGVKSGPELGGEALKEESRAAERLPAAPSPAPAAAAVPEPAPTAVANLANEGDTVVVRTGQGTMIGTVISATATSLCFQGAGSTYDTDSMTNLLSFSVIARSKKVSPGPPPQEGVAPAENSGLQGPVPAVPQRAASGPAVQKIRPRADPVAKQREDFFRAKAKLKSEGYEIVNDAAYRKMIARGNIPTAINVKAGNVFKCVSVADYLKISCPALAAGSRSPREASGVESAVVLVNNNPYALKVTLVNGGTRKAVDVPAGGSVTAKTQPGRHELFMVSSAEPEAEYQGDSFTVAKGAALTVTFNAASGSYTLRRVK